jgi:hypothetical protein
MWHTQARIESPDVIREFRTHFVKFDTRCHQAIGGIQADAQRVSQWLRYEQLSHWKQELRKSEEMVRRAYTAFLLARDAISVYGKSSCVDEKKALRKAELRKAEVEQKLAAVKRWIPILERETEKLMGPINNLSSILDTASPKALGKLDQMTTNLEEYLRAAPPIDVPSADTGAASHGVQP